MLYCWEPAIAFLFASDDRTRVLNYAKFKRLTLRSDLIFQAAGTVPCLRLSTSDEGRQMLDAVTTNAIKHLIVPQLDRLGRKTSAVHSEFVHLTGQIGLTLHVIDLGGDFYTSDNPANRIVLGTLSACARLDRNGRKEFAAQKIKNQEPVGATSFGWKIFDYESVRMIVPDQDEQRWLKEIIQWRQIHKWSFAKIAGELNRLGVKSKQGGKWHKGTLCKLFQNLHVTHFIQHFKTAERCGRPQGPSANAVAERTHRAD